MTRFLLASALLALAPAARAKDNIPPEGFTALFNGKDTTNWKGLIELPQRAKLSADELADKQAAADKMVAPHWTVKDGVLHYDGKGQSLQTAKDFGDFEMLIDWKIAPGGDSGIYLRGNPQVQVWDSDSPKSSKLKGGTKGSGGLWNNTKGGDIPLVKADNAPGEWNTFRIKMVGDKVTIHLNDKLVLKDAALENYWERGKPLPAAGPIELQHHGDELWFKNIYIRELK